jgi:hypothetical protein
LAGNYHNLARLAEIAESSTMNVHPIVHELNPETLLAVMQAYFWAVPVIHAASSCAILDPYCT